MIFHIGFHIGLVYLNMRYDQFGNFQLYLIDNRYFFFLYLILYATMVVNHLLAFVKWQVIHNQGLQNY